MKRLIGFCVFVIILVGIFLYFSLRTKEYEIEYNHDGYDISERYDKEKGKYFFKVGKDELSYDFVIEHKYSKSRKIVKSINEQSSDNYRCVSLKVFDYDTPLICSNGSEYRDAYSLKDEENSNEQIRTVNKISVFNEDYDYFIWNGYGVTNILTEEKYNFLKSESYDNNLSYQMGDYLIVADYDSSREFNIFYLYNNETKKITQWEFEYKISFNSYFMGDVDNCVYLFDKKNKIQYKLNIPDQVITTTSDSEGALFYKNEWDLIAINKLVYTNVYFEKTNLINYSIDDNKVYFNYQDSNKKILFDEKDINEYISIKNNDAFYLKKDTLYKYDINKGRIKLLSYFEWNFSYSNKIFIFD